MSLGGLVQHRMDGGQGLRLAGALGKDCQAGHQRTWEPARVEGSLRQTL